jgi:hypothetical protein
MWQSARHFPNPCAPAGPKRVFSLAPSTIDTYLHRDTSPIRTIVEAIHMTSALYPNRRHFPLMQGHDRQTRSSQPAQIRFRIVSGAKQIDLSGLWLCI